MQPVPPADDKEGKGLVQRDYGSLRLSDLQRCKSDVTCSTWGNPRSDYCMLIIACVQFSFKNSKIEVPISYTD